MDEKRHFTLLEGRKVHFTLIDPDKQPLDKAFLLAEVAARSGTDAFLIGGSSSQAVESLDALCKGLKIRFNLPVILFPATHAQISRHADMIFFMMLMNSEDKRFIIDEQFSGAPLVHDYNIEPLPTGYIIFDSGNFCMCAHFGKANKVPMDHPEIAVNYALVAKYFGMDYVYLEAGSGAKYPVSNEAISAVKKTTGLKVIVGGGIRDEKTALEKLKAGADIIVTGTINEGNEKKMAEIIQAIKKYG